MQLYLTTILLSPIEDDEVKSAIFQMHPEKSPGPDGTSPGFFQRFWPIVGSDIIAGVKEFFNRSVLRKSWGTQT